MPENNTKTAGVDRRHSQSYLQKTAFALLHFLVILICFWLVRLNGSSELGAFFGKAWTTVDPLRANLLLGCAFLYWCRHVFTLFGLLKRDIAWPEVFGLTGFIMLFEIGFILLGSVFTQISAPISALDFIAIAMVMAGSYLNTVSEWQRNIWKKSKTNNGHCYTLGLFKYSMHINYFGDVVLFTGWAMLAASLFALVIPTFIALSFIYFHIPGLDSYLEQRYGDEFIAYAQKTKRLVPFLW